MSLWQTILPSSPGENWTETSFLTVLDGLCAWYSMCDQLKHTAVLSPICLKQLCIIDCCGVWMWCVILTMNHRAPHLFSSAELLSDLSSSVSRPHVVSLECLKLRRLDDRSWFFWGGGTGRVFFYWKWDPEERVCDFLKEEIKQLSVTKERNKLQIHERTLQASRGVGWQVADADWCSQLLARYCSSYASTVG